MKVRVSESPEFLNFALMSVITVIARNMTISSATNTSSRCSVIYKIINTKIIFFFFADLNQPRGACRFPDVLVNRKKWRDLSGKWVLEVESGLQVLRLKDRLSSAGIQYEDGPYGTDTAATKLVIKCVENTYEAQTKAADVLQTDYVTYVTDDNWYVCNTFAGC